MFVNAGIPDLPGFVVLGVRRLKNLTAKCGFERLKVHRRGDCIRPLSEPVRRDDRQAVEDDSGTKASQSTARCHYSHRYTAWKRRNAARGLPEAYPRSASKTPQP